MPESSQKKPEPSDESRGTWKWIEEVRGERWTTPLIPTGDACVARVQRSFSRNGKTRAWDYYAYRSTEYLGSRDSPEKAMVLAQSGEKAPIADAVTRFVDEHPGEIPPFLALTEAERRAVVAQYPHAAPRPEQVRAGLAKQGRERGARSEWPFAADESDPSTRAYLAQASRARGGSEGGAMTTPSGRPSTRRGKGAALADTSQRLALVGAPLNPARPDSGRYARYQLIFDAAAAGHTVAQLLAAGGNEVTLGKCVAKGHVELLAPGAAPEPVVEKKPKKGRK